MTTSGAHHLTRRTCPDCHRWYYSWGKHMEECVGPPPDDGCDCPNGWKHRPDCPLVTGKTRT